jgi:Fe-S-cluster containining protein
LPRAARSVITSSSMLAEYAALVAKVDAFTRAAFDAGRASMACRRGCSSCCEVSLTVNHVEAAALRQALERLDAGAHARITARASKDTGRCVMLDDDGSCAVYAARPLVCRTQGFALRYPPGFIPAGAVRARSSAGEVTHCPLNFTEHAPEAAHVLDAERVDQILALVNVRFAREHGLDPEARHPLRELAASLQTKDPSHP